jgi:hypothetical protein
MSDRQGARAAAPVEGRGVGRPRHPAAAGPAASLGGGATNLSP